VDPLIPDGATITFVRVRYGGKIDAVGLAYRYQGNTYELPMHGGDGGTEDLFNLADGQVITGMSGSYGDVVCQLMFDTNMGPSRAYGQAARAQFNYSFCQGATVIGLFGRSGGLLDAIGCQLRCP
jgi:hypothetical protein